MDGLLLTVLVLYPILHFLHTLFSSKDSDGENWFAICCGLGVSALIAILIGIATGWPLILAFAYMFGIFVVILLAMVIRNGLN